ncbi:50S ribosomal protein L24 [Posidoniimonas polymericola]|uniref:Large ribosomal subunit protein uL24 n=1 Tax=Posidoniimonas polymericola TaxID=2528002 RepID=A0A5C5YD83_9BACT|nr:50S ribosomal protein L24 [Posidoniimonas polymericola]TWT73666.1 50S ribosomal protein L24 [Posidoniimonas polymericola]
MLIKTGDTVQIITGADKGVRSRVTSIDRTAGKALVEGVNMVLKHVRRSQKYPQGGRLNKEMPVQVSNIAYFCESCSKPTRLGARYLDDGSKERFCKKCGTAHGQIAPAKAAHAKK